MNRCMSKIYPTLLQITKLLIPYSLALEYKNHFSQGHHQSSTNFQIEILKIKELYWWKPVQKFDRKEYCINGLPLIAKKYPKIFINIPSPRQPWLHKKSQVLMISRGPTDKYSNALWCLDIGQFKQPWKKKKFDCEIKYVEL